MTVDSVRARTKTVTRRHVGTWKDLKPGDRLTLIEKGMGLPKGAKHVVLAEVEIVDVRVEPLGAICQEDDYDNEGVYREGLGDQMDQAEFMRFWAGSHGYGTPPYRNLLQVPCRRIEWRYLDGAA